VITRESVTRSGWPVRPLADVVEFLDNRRKPVTEKDRVAGPYIYYGANGPQGTIDQFIFDEPTILVAEDGGNFGQEGRTIAYQVEGKYWVNNHAHVLRPKPGVDIRFLCRHLEHYDVTPFVNGTTRGKLTKGNTEQIPIALPPLAEQKRIAAVLDKADDLRGKRRQSLATLDTLAASAYQQVVSGSDVKHSRLDEVAEVITGFAFPSARFCSEKAGVRLCRGANVLPRSLDWHDTAWWPEAQAAEVERFFLAVEDVILALDRPWISSGLKIAIVNANDLPSLLVQRVARIRASDPRMNVVIYNAIQHHDFMKHCRITETTIPHISPKDVQSFVVPVPSDKALRRFSQVAAPLDRTRHCMLAQAAHLGAFFAALQSAAFSGNQIGDKNPEIMDRLKEMEGSLH
jgi:type I restriction enzyme S subunit